MKDKLGCIKFSKETQKSSNQLNRVSSKSIFE